MGLGFAEVMVLGLFSLMVMVLVLVLLLALVVVIHLSNVIGTLENPMAVNVFDPAVDDSDTY